MKKFTYKTCLRLSETLKDDMTAICDSTKSMSQISYAVRLPRVFRRCVLSLTMKLASTFLSDALVST